MPSFRFAALLAAALAVLAAQAHAQNRRAAPAPGPAAPPSPALPGMESDAQAARRYARCLQDAARRPSDAFEDALAWRDLGGGDPARHCAAVALIYLGRHAQAAERLELLAKEMRTRAPELRAQVLGQAGRAWLEAGQAPRAYAALSSGLEMNPDDIELWIDRAEALAAAKNFKEAADDLSQALVINPRRADALALRAAAWRYLDELDRAMADAERAVALGPNLPEAWLERGILFRMKGDTAKARADWLKVLVLDGDGPTGDVARANIERLELKLDDAPANRPPGRTNERAPAR